MSPDVAKVDLPIVSADWLLEHLYDNDVRIVEASWHMPATGRDALAEYRKGHIPGAVFFDIDEHSAASALPHMLPEPEQFAQAAGSLGIADHHRIVVYDSMGLFSAARVWWMFRHYGAAQVYVLDGGLPAWQRAGGEQVSSPEDSNVVFDSSGRHHAGQHEACVFNVGESPSQRQAEVVDANDILASIDDDGSVILDARSAGRFSAHEKETRQGLRSGHIPGSICLPFTEILDEQGLCKSVDELAAMFDELQLTPQNRIITTCGSGVTAAILCLALESVGYTNVALYDGSWTEWGGLDAMPVATGD